MISFEFLLLILLFLLCKYLLGNCRYQRQLVNVQLLRQYTLMHFQYHLIDRNVVQETKLSKVNKVEIHETLKMKM